MWLCTAPSAILPTSLHSWGPNGRQANGVDTGTWCLAPEETL